MGQRECFRGEKQEYRMKWNGNATYQNMEDDNTYWEGNLQSKILALGRGMFWNQSSKFLHQETINIRAR